MTMEVLVDGETVSYQTSLPVRVFFVQLVCDVTSCFRFYLGDQNACVLCHLSVRSVLKHVGETALKLGCNLKQSQETVSKF